jgi:uncharacterized protein DUF6875
MPTQTTDLFRPEDLQEAGRASGLATSDLDGLHAVSDWIKSYVVRPHADLGRPGPVCRLVPVSLERDVLWCAPEHIGDGGAPRLVELMNRYKGRLLGAAPTDGDDGQYAVIVVVFTDLSADRAPGIFNAALQQLAVSSYVEDGIVFGPFYKDHEGTAIYNADFRPFQSPVPFMFVRRGVIDDWKFFLDDPDWFTHWSRRFGESGTHALAGELRRLPWRARQD